MPLPAPEPHVRWLNPTTGHVRFATVAGPIHSYLVHWIKIPDRRPLAARCRAEDPGEHICPICLDHPDPPRRRYIIPVWLAGCPNQRTDRLRPHAPLYLLELGRDHWPLLERIDADGAAGTELQISPGDRPSKTQLRIVVRGHHPLPDHLLPVDVRDTVAALGLTQLAAVHAALRADRPTEPTTDSPSRNAPPETTR